MNDTIPLRTRRLTAEEVLERLRALAACMSDPSNIDFDTTVSDYCGQLELGDDLSVWNSPEEHMLSRVLEASCGVPMDNWQDVLLPSEVRTLRDVCEHVAANTAVIVPEPVTVLGRRCLSAGAFLAVRTLLGQAGAEVGDLGPSSPLEPYLRAHPQVFKRDIGWMVPPTVFFQVPLSARRWDCGLLALAVLCAIGFMVAVGGMFVAAMSKSAIGVVIASACIMATLYGVLASYKASHWFMGQIALPGLRDFRDLIDTILYRPLRRTVHPETMS
jgi:hypothetical protein